MLSWIIANIGTIVICAILVVIVGCIITVMVRNKKKGKSHCGGNCGHCAMGGACHKQ